MLHLFEFSDPFYISLHPYLEYIHYSDRGFQYLKNDNPGMTVNGRQQLIETLQSDNVEKILQDGVVIHEEIIGKGNVAEPGDNLTSIAYTSYTLESENVLVATIFNDDAFRFILGSEEVIRGWNIGIAGMKVGSKRRITCPSETAYGKAGIPLIIPPDATIVFDINLLAVE